MDDRVTIRPADRNEADAIASMWAEAGRWLKSKMIDQWQYPANQEKLSRDIEQGHAYVMTNGSEYLGTITVDGFADPEFWLPGDLPDSALYAHRIIVRPNVSGSSLGVSMLDWASQKAAKLGKSWLRVDAWKTNSDLGRYYESQGFTHVRTVDLPHRRSGALYQRPAGVTVGAGPRYLGLEAWKVDENGNPEWGWTTGL
ncbi:GNAT family N-acetyltransferase [Streptomyces sp. NPDC001410]|uniref:GNAT family N-acetyltransferase n=1 Tax=Streptomyces sp. NPDC001410 TaxID=3364574 RepID=UPI003699AE8A